MFVPTLNRICDIQLRAHQVEPVILGDGQQRPLLRVEQTTKLDGKARPEYDIKMWVDGAGQVLKLEQDLLGGYIQYRTTKEAALSEGGPIQFDLISGTVIKTARKITDAGKTRYVKYRLTLKDGDLAQIVPNDARQTLQRESSGNSAVLEVRSLGPLEGPSAAVEAAPQFLKANALVTSEDSQVRRLAARATRGVVDPWEKVVQIDRFVFQNMRDKNFEVAFASASEVARNLSGDCTEHAVLAAAMCRAQGIPARVVVGLIYVDQHSGFGFHMWNEVYVNERWVAVDPSYDEAPVDAVHIKLSDSSLDGVAPFEVLMPVIRVMGKLEIEPIETQ
jgi:transglutaminase-like putative cysteine protease